MYQYAIITVNKMLEQVKTSTTNIESTLSQLSEDKSRGLQYQIDECEKRERDLMEKLRNIEYETKETDKRILSSEKDIQEFRVKAEVIRQEQGKDFEGSKEELRKEEAHFKRIVEETEIKQQEAEFNLERINKEIQELQAEYDDKISAVELERKIVVAERQHLVEMIQMERANQDRKLIELDKVDHELTQEEMDFEQRKLEYEQREDEVNESYNQLKARNEIYEDDKVKFEEEAMKVLQYLLMVQQESERIANFKSNYDTMRKELEKAREIIARERAIVKTEKLKHLELLGELETKQRALELIRTEYIKERADIAQQMWSIKRPLEYKVDFKAPSVKDLPEPKILQIPSAPAVSMLPYNFPARKMKQTTDYRKNRSDPNDFQMFLLKEKEFQLNVMNSLNQSDSLQNSMKKSANYEGSFLSNQKSPGYLFPTDTKQYRPRDSFNSESSGSIKYLSKNLNS